MGRRQGSAIRALRVRKQTLEPAPVSTGEGSRDSPRPSGRSGGPAAGAQTSAPGRGIRRIVAAVGVASLGLIGCSGNHAQDSSAKKTVTVLTHDAFNLPKDAIRRFETTTGYKLKTISSGEAGVANQLVLTKKHPKYDAVYGIDTYSAGLADKEGVIDSYTSSKLPESGKRYVIGGLNPIDQGDVCVNTDHAWFKKKSIPEPTSLDDLAKPEYAKLLVVSNPTTSSPGLAFLAGVEKAKGRKGADAYWKALLVGGTKVAKSWSEAYNSDFSAGEGKGQYPLVLSYGSSPAETKGATGSVASARSSTQVSSRAAEIKRAPGRSSTTCCPTPSRPPSPDRCTCSPSTRPSPSPKSGRPTRDSPTSPSCPTRPT